MPIKMNGSLMGIAIPSAARRMGPVLLILMILMGSAGAGLSAPQTAQPAGPLALSQADPTGVTLAWQAPLPVATILPDGAVRLDMPGFLHNETPGQARLPVSSVVVALPPGAQPALIVLERQEEFRPLEGGLELAPIPVAARRDAYGAALPTLAAPDQVPAADSQALAAASPAAPVSWERLGVMGGIALARVSFYPLAPAAGGLRYVSSIRVRFDFNALSEAGLPAASPLADVVRQTVVNPGQVVTRSTPLRLSAPQVAVPTWIIQVAQTGLTEISYSGLQADGFPLATVNPQHLHIFQDTLEIDAEWEGDSDAVFEPGERLLFFANPRPNRWAAYDTYQLVETETNAARMGARSANPAGVLTGRVFLTQVFEQNLIYTPRCYCGPTPVGYDGERWAWKEVSLPANNPVKTQVTLSNIDTTQPGKITVHLVSFTETIQNPDHKVQIYWNATLLGEETWNGKLSQSFTYPAPAGLLVNGINELVVNLPGLSGVSKEGLWLDAFSVQAPLDAPAAAPAPPNARLFEGDPVQRAYQIKLGTANGLRAYQVTDPLHPLRLTDVQLAGQVIGLKDPNPVAVQRYAVLSAEGVLQPQAIRQKQSLPVISQSGFQGAAYLAVSAPEFASAVPPLLDMRRATLGSAALQALQPIYDTYAFGRPDPQAIHDYLDDAYHTWPTPPAYVLLVGDGTYDPSRYLTTSHASYLPPYLASVDPWAGETAADNLFVTVDGDDNLPDMLIGRLPVNTTAETQAVVNKIIAYQGQPSTLDWLKRQTLVGDDSAALENFAGYLDQIAANTISPPYTANKLYYQPPVTPVQMRTNVRQSFQDGSLVTIFFGHSSYHQWAIENFLHVSDVTALNNSPRLPIVLEMTCFTSEFQLPDLTTLDETLLTRANGGAVATWGMSGLGLAQGHVYLAEGFMHGLLVDQEPVLGKLAVQGKLNLVNNVPAYDYMVDTFTLLGDPAMQAHAPYLPLHNIFMPFVAR